MFASAFLLLGLTGSALCAPAYTSSYKSGVPDTTVLQAPFPALTDNNALQTVQKLGLGTLPNGPAPPPGAISPDGITNLQLIELNEFFESAFFISLLKNITDNVPGFEIHDQDEKNFVTDALVAIIAQEELHGVNADKALQSQNAVTIKPCQYKFPSSNFADAVAFASTFTDVVLGALQDVIEIFAINNDNGLTRGVASVVGQEGEQNGFYRILQNKNKVPSQLPFLTTSTRDFAFSSLEQGVIVSCPNDDVLKAKLNIFGVLNLVSAPTGPADQTLKFSFDLQSLSKSNIAKSNGGNSWSMYGNTYQPGYDWSQVSLVYMNQQNTPVVEKLQNTRVEGTVVTFEAPFPYTQNLMNGLTVAAITKSSGPFASAGAVANATLFAPAFIEIN